MSTHVNKRSPLSTSSLPSDNSRQDSTEKHRGSSSMSPPHRQHLVYFTSCVSAEWRATAALNQQEEEQCLDELKTALKKKSEHEEKITDGLKWFHAWIKRSYRAGAASPPWRTSLCPPAGSYQSFYSSPPQLCLRRWSCSPFLMFNLFIYFHSGTTCLVSVRVFSSSDDPRGAVSWSFPSEGRREGGERRWHRRLVCHTVEPESGARLSQLQSTHCCLSMWL